MSCLSLRFVAKIRAVESGHIVFETAAGECLPVPAVDPAEAKMTAIFKSVKSRGPGRGRCGVIV